MTDKGDSKNFSIEIESIFGQEMFENVKKEPNSDEEVGLLLVAPSVMDDKHHIVTYVKSLVLIEFLVDCCKLEILSTFSDIVIMRRLRNKLEREFYV